MLQKATLLILFIFILSGCAVSPKTKTKQQPIADEKSQDVYYQEQRYSRYDFDDKQAPAAYTRPAKQPQPALVIHLSPRQIQRALKNAGFYKGAIDGKIGPQTKEAILQFQRAKKLKADGIVGKKTSAELSKYLTK